MTISKLFVTISIAICSITGQSQTPSLKPASTITKNHLQVYRNAVNCGDYTTAIMALNYVVVESKNGKYLDSLAYLYYFSNNFNQSIYWCSEALKFRPNDISLLELKATNLKHTKQIFLAIEIYEYLMKISPSPIFAFNLIELQYTAKRLYECLLTTNLTESLSFKNDMKYSYKINESSIYSTPLKAAIYNYKGLVLLDLKDTLQAKTAFETALSIDSTFILAKNNLSSLFNKKVVESGLPLEDKSVSNDVLKLPKEVDIKKK